MRVHLFLVALALQSATAAAQITISIRADTTARPPLLDVRVTVANSGKEAAHNVQVTLSDAARTALPAIGMLEPGGNHQVQATIDIAGKNPGRHPLPVTVAYADQNGYPFSAILCATYFVERDTSSDLFGTIACEPFQNSARIQAHLKNTSARDHAFTLAVLTPRELTAEAPAPRTLKAGAETTLEIGLRNFSALPGSRYPLFLVAEYDQDGKHFTSVLTTSVEIITEIAFFTRYRRWILAAAGFFAVLGVALWFVRSRRQT